MEVQHIEEEMNQLKNRLAFLEECLKETQQKCAHHYTGNEYYEKCNKCHKVNVFYY